MIYYFHFQSIKTFYFQSDTDKAVFNWSVHRSLKNFALGKQIDHSKKTDRIIK